MERPVYSFTLYLRDQSEASVENVRRLSAFCRKYLLFNHTLALVDLSSTPDAGKADGVQTAPTTVVNLSGHTLQIPGSLPENPDDFWKALKASALSEPQAEVKFRGGA